MKKIFKIMSVSAACAAVLASCAKEPADIDNGNGNGQKPGPDTETVTVSLQVAASTPEKFELEQSADGTVTGNVEFSFIARLSEASGEDVSVSFEASCAGIGADKILLSKDNVVISAGETSSEEIRVSVNDWSGLASVDEAKDYTLTVSIAETSAETASEGSSVSVVVSKPARPVTVDAVVGLSEPSAASFKLSHTSAGINGSVSFTVYAMISEAVQEDVTLSLEAECPGISTDKIIISPVDVTVPAGKTLSDKVTVSISDFSDLLSTETAADYTLTLRIKDASVGVDPENASVSVTISKSALGDSSVFPEFGSNFLSITTVGALTANYKENRNAADWNFSFWTTSGNNLENPVDNTVTGTGTSDVACNDDKINFTVDFNEVKTLGGLYFQHWGIEYCPTKIRLSVSENGEDWIEMGTLNTTNINYIGFKEAVSTRYMKYEMLEVAGSRVDIMVMFIYEK